MNIPKLLIFDLDGTLIDSGADVTLALNRVLKQLNIPAVDEACVDPYIATGVRPLLRELASRHGLTNIDAVFAAFDDVYGKCLLENTKLFPGVLDVLEGFNSTAKVVLTNKLQKFIAPILNGLGVAHHFQYVFGRDAFAKMKPDPLPVLMSCKSCSVDPNDALMIGDTSTDINAAKAAGVRSCAVLYGYGNPTELSKLSPDFTVDHAVQILDIFSR